MSWPNELKIFSLLLFAVVMLGCGVKGDPLPPEKPVELGRGRPTYKRATEGITIEKRRVPEPDEEDDEDDERE